MVVPSVAAVLITTLGALAHRVMDQAPPWVSEGSMASRAEGEYGS